MSTNFQDIDGDRFQSGGYYLGEGFSKVTGLNDTRTGSIQKGDLLRFFLKNVEVMRFNSITKEVSFLPPYSLLLSGDRLVEQFCPAITIYQI